MADRRRRGGPAGEFLAELARDLKDAETEGIFLYRVFERLVRVAECVDTPVALRLSCVRHLPLAVDALVGYLADQGLMGLASRHIERAQSATLEVERAAGVAASQRPSATTGVRSVGGRRSP